jgi:predicted dehydrogenase
MARLDRLGYAVVGLGRISERAVLPAFRHSKLSKLAAVVSGDPKKARRLATRFHAPAWYTYDRYAECLSNPDVQAVFIATNNGTHLGFTLPAAEAGRHVLCEKPMANTVEECQEMIRACRRHDVRLMIAYRKFFEPAALALKKIVSGGKLGRLKIIHSAFSFFLRPGGRSAPWHLDTQAAGGGPLVDVGVYCVNTVRWLTGLEPEAAAGYGWSTDPERFRNAPESMAFQLRFPRGIVMQASASFGAAQASFLEVFGEKGWAALDPAYTFDEKRRLFGKIDGRWFEQRFKVIDEFALELDALARSIQLRREPGPSGIEGLRDVAVMEAIHRAAQEGGWVRVEYPRGCV